MSLYEYERNGEAQELIRVLQESESPRVRARAAEVLGRLVEVATDPDGDSDVRSQAVFVLGKIGDGETARELERLLDDTEDEQIRERAFSALSKLGGHTGT